MVSPRRIRLHRGIRLESETDPDDVDMDVDDSAGSEDGSGEPDDAEGADDADGERDEDELESEQGGVPSSTSAPSRLKIKFKMPIPSRNDTPVIESEDEDEDEVMGSEAEELYSEDQDEDDQPKIKHPLTSRQAALASVSDPSHVSLESLRGRGRGRGRGRLIGEAEMKLRREETARKRRNFVEKKLEDEKAETINRLLKKQSRPRGKRAKDVAPPAADADSDDGVDQDTPPNEHEHEPPPPPPPPTMYRWISTSRVPSSLTTATTNEPKTSVTFSIPPSLVSSTFHAPATNSMPQESIRPPRLTSCAAPGCGGPFRYRLVKDWTRGACGIECLKALEGALVGM